MPPEKPCDASLWQSAEERQVVLSQQQGNRKAFASTPETTKCCAMLAIWVGGQLATSLYLLCCALRSECADVGVAESDPR
jgi:hypothetical protein